MYGDQSGEFALWILGLKRVNHNYKKIPKFDWLSTALISALIGQCHYASGLSNWKVRAIARAQINGFFFTANKKLLNFLEFLF